MNGLAQASWLALGGALGTLARYGVSRLTIRLVGAGFPWGTLIVNVTGSFALGFIATLLALRIVPHSEVVRLGFAVGFLGAYTTFSTYEFESSQLLSDGQWLLASANLLGSVAAGLLAVRLGIVLARRFET